MFLESQHFVDHAFVRAKTNRVAKESRDCAKLATVRTAATGLNRHHMDRTPSGALFLQKRPRHLWDHVELVQVHCVPGNRRIRLEAWLAFLPGFIKGRIDFLETSIRRVFHDLRPCLISFAERNCISMARPTLSTQRF